MKKNDAFKEYYEEYYEEAEELPKRKRKKRPGVRLYRFLSSLLGLGIVVIGIYVLFFIQDTAVTGNDYTSTSSITKTVLNDKYSINSIYVWAKYKLGKGESLPTLNSIKVSMKNPWTLKVTVEEKAIAGYIGKDSSFVYFDSDGMVVYKDTILKDGVPKIEGLTIGNMELYDYLDVEDKEIFTQIIKATKEVKNNNIKTEKIIYMNDSIYLNQGNIFISLGTEVSADQIAQIPPILELLAGQEGTLHLENYSQDKESVSFKKGEFPTEN